MTVLGQLLVDNAEQGWSSVRLHAVMPAETFELPGFDVVRLIGFGASGEVWLARDLASGDRVALKRVIGPHTEQQADESAREAALQSTLEHPHLVRLRELVAHGDDVVLVLDHVDGGNLSQVLAARALSPGEVVTVLVPIAQAVSYLHGRGVVHGDLSPANVLFGRDGRPVLADLGVARSFGRPHEDVVGTTGFLAPEAVAGEPHTPASDVYALGRLALTALRGPYPAHQATDEDAPGVPQQ